MRRGYGAWSRDDFEAFRKMLHPDVEWHSSGAFPGLEPVYHGHEGVAKWYRTLREPFETFTIEPLEFTEHGDALVVDVTFHAVGKESGVEVRLPFAHVFWFEGDLIRRYASYRTLDEALAQVGP
jgi:ketosteroid isomerase-like protein